MIYNKLDRKTIYSIKNEIAKSDNVNGHSPFKEVTDDNYEIVNFIGEKSRKAWCNMTTYNRNDIENELYKTSESIF